jgi:hypothetical protein
LRLKALINGLPVLTAWLIPFVTGCEMNKLLLIAVFPWPLSYLAGQMSNIIRKKRYLEMFGPNTVLATAHFAYSKYILPFGKLEFYTFYGGLVCKWKNRVVFVLFVFRIHIIGMA